MKYSMASGRFCEVLELNSTALGAMCEVDKRQGVYRDLPYVGLEDIESGTGQFLGSLEPRSVKSSTFRFSSEHVLYGRLRPYLNKVMLPDFVGHCSTEIFPLRPRPGLNRDFLQYWLRMAGTVQRINATSTGTRMPRANVSAVLGFPIPLPPLAEQHRIVAVLDQTIEDIATARANTQRNLEHARALFESHLAAVFTPEHQHPLVPIGDVGEVFDGPHATPRTVNEGPIFLGISALQDGQVNLGETRHVTPDDFQRWTRRVKPQSGDVVFSYETRLGQVAIIPNGLECCLGRRMGLVRVDRARIDPRFFVYQYLSPTFRSFLDSRTVHGATVDRIAIKEFPSVPIRVPGLAEQQHIVDRLDALREECQRLESLYQRKLDVLDNLRESILHHAFTGQL